MAKSPQLVAAVSKVVRKPEETVRVALRRLHEAGLIEVTGKGRGGKHMTPRDAAMLLLAMSTGTMLKDSPTAIQDYWNLPLLPTDPHRFDRWGFPSSARPALTGRYFGKIFTKKISPVDTLGTVLSTILESATARTLFPRAERGDFMKPPEPHIPLPAEVPDSHLQVRIYAPWRAAAIDMRINRQWRSELLFGEPVALQEEMFPGENRVGSAEYVEIRRFSEAAIVAIAESLR